jgi:LysM repeat protein
MTKRRSATARILAVLALVAAFVVVIVLISAALGGDDEGGSGRNGNGQVGKQQQQKPDKKVPAAYEVEEGDTLTAIAHKTGVPVGQIERLNPGIDPQILEPGEKLKLR